MSTRVPHSLVGRSREIEQLDTCLERAAEGQGTLALLLGEAGVGKTSLARVASETAAERAFVTGWGRATTHGGAPPYWILSQALQPLLETDGAAEAIVSAALFEVVPEARALRPDLPVVAFADATTAQFAIARAVARFLGRIGRQQPVLLVLDDLQDADIASLRVIELLANDLERMSTAIVATARDRDWSDAPMQREILAALLRAGTTIEVDRLSLGATAELVRRHAAAGDELIARVHSATAGNALFVAEIARALGTTSHAADAELPLPIGVRELVRQRLSRQPEPVRRALAAAAVLGLDASEAEVGAVTGAPVPTELDLATLRNARVTFSHGLLREGIYATLSEAERRDLHRRAARVIEDHDSSRSRDARRAYHLSRSGPDSAHEAAEAALRAAEIASGGGAFHDAIALLDTLPREALGPSTRLDLTLATARSALLLGETTRGAALVSEATELARGLRDPRRLAEAALVRGSVFTFGYSDPLLVGALAEALEIVDPEDSALRARLLARLAAARQPSDDPYATAEEALIAVELARTTGDSAVLLEVLYTSMAAAFEYVPPARRRPLNEECVRLAQAHGNITFEWRARTRLLFDAFELGDISEADAMIAELHRLAATLGQDTYRYTLARARAMRALFLGHFDEAERARRDAHALGGDDLMTSFYHRIHMLGVHRSLRQTAAAAALGAELAQMLERGGYAEYGRNLLLAAAASAGDGAAVADLLDGELPRRFLQERPLALTLAEVADALSDGQAQTLYDWFAPHAGEFLSSGATGYYVDAPVDHALALVAERLGDGEAAISHIQHALALLRRVGARPHLARALADAARILGSHGDERAAARFAAEAADVAGSLGAQSLVDFVDAASAGRTGAISDDGSEPAALSLVRADDGWTISFGRRQLALKPNVGLDVLEQLMLRPSEEVHVLELIGSEEPAATNASLGDLLDPRAKAEYKRRLDELGEEIEAARARGRVARAEALESERIWLVRELAAAFGLGGKARPVGATAEKARVTVQRRLRRAIDRIREDDAEIAAVLDACVKTGTYCSYTPLPLQLVTM